MSKLLEKSIESIKAAKLLASNRFFASVVNRSYYGCVQFLLHKLFTTLKFKKDEFDAHRRQNREGSHGWASKLIQFELAKIDYDDFKWFQKEFPEFQKLREKADYQNEEISQLEAQRAIDKAEAIINLVNSKIKERK